MVFVSDRQRKAVMARLNQGSLKSDVSPQIITLRRVSFARKETPIDKREFKINGKGPVGTIKEFKKAFPKSKLKVIDNNAKLKNQPKSKFTKAVFPALLIETPEHKQQLMDGFKKLGFHPPKIFGTFKTLPGKGGEGGRSDVVIGIDNRDVPRFAVSPLRFGQRISWHDDYLVNNRTIIPEQAKSKFFKDVK